MAHLLPYFWLPTPGRLFIYGFDSLQIIFSSKKRNCDKLAQAAWDRGFAVDSLHGDREQWERTKVMDQYRSGEVRLLVATDVAARGLDVKDISYVINYDFPVDGVEVS